MMADILILLENHLDLPQTSPGLTVLRELEISFSLRMGSVFRGPNLVADLIAEFEAKATPGKVVICVATEAAHLAAYVTSLTIRPVIAVPLADPTNLSPMPSNSSTPVGFPVATMIPGTVGFTNACLLAAQIMATSHQQLRSKLQVDRQRLMAQQIESDAEFRIDPS